MPDTENIENKQISTTIKSIIVSIIGTVSIVCTVMINYGNLQNSISELKNSQERAISDIRHENETRDRVNDIRLKALETRVSLLEQEVNKR